MKLKVELSGTIDHVVITALPETFIIKIFKHCLGKNNTPYFANNCFKGVLYFDEEFARRLAEGTGAVWNVWSEQNRFYNHCGASFGPSTQIVARFADEAIRLTSAELSPRKNTLDMDAMLAELAANEVMLVLGSVDKGSEYYELEDFDADFDPEKLELSLDTFSDFRLEDEVVRSLSYAGAPLALKPGKRLGRNMLTPRLFSRQGRELEVFDFMQ